MSHQSPAGLYELLQATPADVHWVRLCLERVPRVPCRGLEAALPAAHSQTLSMNTATGSRNDVPGSIAISNPHPGLVPRP